jgi:hypothetical protein
MKKLLILFALIALGSVMNEASAQCKVFAKKKCLPQLADYTHDGKMNIATVWPGDKAELMMTFYANTPYRLLVCPQEMLGQVTFKVKDLQNNIIFESKPGGNPYLDFKVAATQQLVVEISIPEKEKKLNDIEYQGCIAVFVGMK